VSDSPRPPQAGSGRWEPRFLKLSSQLIRCGIRSRVLPRVEFAGSRMITEFLEPFSRPDWLVKHRMCRHGSPFPGRHFRFPRSIRARLWRLFVDRATFACSDQRGVAGTGCPWLTIIRLGGPARSPGRGPIKPLRCFSNRDQCAQPPLRVWHRRGAPIKIWNGARLSRPVAVHFSCRLDTFAFALHESATPRFTRSGSLAPPVLNN